MRGRTMTSAPDLLKLVHRWKRHATRERRILTSTSNYDSKARSYGAWLAYRQCALELKKIAK